MSESVKDTMEGVEWNVPGKDLDQLIRKWAIKRQHDEVYEWYNDQREMTM